MKITIEPYSGGTFTAQSDAEHIDEVARMIKGLLVAASFHPETVNDLFNRDLGDWYEGTHAENDGDSDES